MNTKKNLKIWNSTVKEIVQHLEAIPKADWWLFFADKIHHYTTAKEIFEMGINHAIEEVKKLGEEQ